MKPEKIYSSQILIVTSFIVLYLLFKNEYLLYTSATLGLLFLFFPSFGVYFINKWFVLGQFLGKINSNILLFIIYIFILLPIAFMKRTATKQSKIKLKKPTDSTFTNRNETYSKHNLEYGW